MSTPELEKFRAQIDALDVELIDVLARRFDVVKAVGDYKSGTDLTVVQPVRARAVKDRAVEMGVAKGLDPAFVRKLYDMMIDHAHVLEDALQETGEDG